MRKSILEEFARGNISPNLGSFKKRFALWAGYENFK